MNFNTRDYIKSVTEIDRNQQVTDNLTWATIVRNKKNIPSPRGKGEIPYQMELKKMNNTKLIKKKKNINNMPNSPEKNVDIHKEKSNNQNIYNQNNFSHIASSVREANGGYNTQSNEMIEKRNKERQKKYIEENNNSDSSSSLNTSYVTASSETDSYKTTFQNLSDTYIERCDQKYKTSIEIYNHIYKKNALMRGLIQNGSVNLPDQNEVDNVSADNLVLSELNGENNEENLNTKDQENLMRVDNIVRLFQSQEDEEIYYHPLKEQIQKDPEWQNMRLARKGTEVILSARQYYMNMDNDSFAFETPSRN